MRQLEIAAIGQVEVLGLPPDMEQIQEPIAHTAHLLHQEAVEPIVHLPLLEVVEHTEAEPQEELPRVTALEEAQEVINLREELLLEAAIIAGPVEVQEALAAIEAQVEAQEAVVTEAALAEEAEVLVALEVQVEVGLLPVGLQAVAVVDEEDKHIHFIN